MKFFLGLLFISFSCFGSGPEYASSFLIELYDQKVKVTSPKSKKKIVSIIVQNNMNETLRANIVANGKVVKRFAVNPTAKEVLQIKYKGIRNLQLVPLSPPSQAVHLKFNQRPYEIPEKN